MDLMQTLRERAAAKPMRAAFPEGENETHDAGGRKDRRRAALAECVLVGDGSKLKELADERGISLDGIEVVDVTTRRRTPLAASAIFRIRIASLSQGRRAPYDASA